MTEQNPAPEAAPAAEGEETEITLTQSQLNAIVAKRNASVSNEKIEKRAHELAQDALSQVSTLKQEVEASKLENQLIKHEAAGLNPELLKATGLSGEALDAFAEKLKAEIKPVEHKQDSRGGSEAVAAFLNQKVESGSKSSDWRADLISQMRGQ